MSTASAVERFPTTFEQKIDYGVSLAGMGGGIFGFEVDFRLLAELLRVTNNDLEASTSIGDGNVTTLMGNLIVVGGAAWRSSGPTPPAASVSSASTCSTVRRILRQGLDQTISGMDVGGGVMFFSRTSASAGPSLLPFTATTTIRTASTSSLGDFQFWRGSLGVTFKF